MGLRDRWSRLQTHEKLALVVFGGPAITCVVAAPVATFMEESPSPRPTASSKEPDREGEAQPEPDRENHEAELERAIAEEREFLAMSDEEHLAAAKDLKGTDRRKARRHLRHIDADDGSVAREAQQLSAEIDREEAREAERRREAVAEGYDRVFIDMGWEVDGVDAVGPEKRKLRIRYPLCGRVWMNELFGKSDLLSKMRDLGFEEVECRGAAKRVTYEL